MKAVETVMRAINARDEPLKLGDEMLAIEQLYFPSITSKTLFVGNLPSQADTGISEDIAFLFDEYGEVDHVSA
jgi:hypothetical protein